MRYRLQSILESFAARDNDVDAWIAIRATDLSSAYAYLQVAKLCACVSPSVSCTHQQPSCALRNRLGDPGALSVRRVEAQRSRQPPHDLADFLFEYGDVNGLAR